MMSNHDDRPGGNRLLLGAGAALLMAACCAVPILIAGGVLAGAGGLLGKPWVIGTGISLLVLALLAVTRRRSGRDRSGHGRCPPHDDREPH